MTYYQNIPRWAERHLFEKGCFISHWCLVFWTARGLLVAMAGYYPLRSTSTIQPYDMRTAVARSTFGWPCLR